MIYSKAEATPDNLRRELDAFAGQMGLATIEETNYFPKFFQIETTRLCNARCPFCAIDKWDKSTPMMSDSLWSKIARELIEYRDWIKFVDLQRSGEPLLDRQIYGRVKELKDGGVKHVAITTNASALTEQNARKLLDAGIDEVMLSIDSVRKEPYELMRVGLVFETVVENIRRYFTLRDEMRPASIIRVRGVSFHDPESTQDRDEMEAWEAFWGGLTKPQDRVYMKRAHNWGNQLVIDGHTPEYDWVYHPCIIPWSTMHITAMGTVGLCPQDYDGLANLGDINTHSIAEVWQGLKAADVRRLHASGNRNEIAFCQGCRLFDADYSLESKPGHQDSGQRPLKLEGVLRKARSIA